MPLDLYNCLLCWTGTCYWFSENISQNPKNRLQRWNLNIFESIQTDYHSFSIIIHLRNTVAIRELFEYICIYKVIETLKKLFDKSSQPIDHWGCAQPHHTHIYAVDYKLITTLISQIYIYMEKYFLKSQIALSPQALKDLWIRCGFGASKKY